MKTVKPLIATLLLTLPCFASVHYISQTLKPTAKLVYFPVRKSVYPAKHPVKTVKGTVKGFTTAVKTVF